jgi:hypothetical protein
VLRDELAESQTFVQLAHQGQAAVGGDSRSLEIDLPASVEGELKGLVWLLTHSVYTAVSVFSRL